MTEPITVIRKRLAPSDIQRIRKTADGDPVNDSTALVNDPELLFAVGANEGWAFRLYLFGNSGATPDTKVAWAIPSGASGFWHFEETSATTSALTSGLRMSGAGADSLGSFWGILVNGATAGNLQLQWAQWVADSSDTKILTNSCIIATRIA